MAQWRHIKQVFLEKAWRIAQYLIHHLNKLGKFTIIYLKIEFKRKKKSDFAFLCLVRLSTHNKTLKKERK
jgi:hypothetical protein